MVSSERGAGARGVGRRRSGVCGEMVLLMLIDRRLAQRMA